MNKRPELLCFARIGLAALLALAGCAPTLNLDAKRAPSHANIEVRLFNPFHTRSTNLLVKGWQALRDSVRLNRRMHNKAFIADNQLGITGGRNIGDEYFDAHHDLAFVDLDVVAAGAIVDSLSQSFDEYWNSDAAVPASALPVTAIPGCNAPAGSCSSSARNRSAASTAAR
ncbi:MAG: phospholipase D-like domain-containing protein [Thiobacillus sp.]|nr:phospholipase D-like domain-containing protein [Thiobacillus sp.]